MAAGHVSENTPFIFMIMMFLQSVTEAYSKTKVQDLPAGVVRTCGLLVASPDAIRLVEARLLN